MSDIDTSQHDSLIKRLMAVGYTAPQSADRAALYGKAMNALAGLCPEIDLSSKRIAAFLVPGRIEFLGKHTDYAGGRSLLCTVERGFAIVACPRTDRLIRIIDSATSRAVTFTLDPELEVKDGHWSNYAMTVARRIARNFSGELVGADIAFASDLPQSSGMSSSSAMVVAFFLAIAKINRLGERAEYFQNIWSSEDLAGYLGTVENGQTFRGFEGDRGVGTFGGSEDHTAILCSRPGFLRQYAFCPVRLERDIPLPDGYVLAIGASGVVAEKTGAARDSYNSLSTSVQTILELLNRNTPFVSETLAEAVARGIDLIDALRKLVSEVQPADLSTRLADRLEQFIQEHTNIIPEAVDAIGDGRLNDLGRIVQSSQEFAERLLKNQVPETIYLAKAAREYGAVAASAFGAGFGGSVWALVAAENAEEFLAHWSNGYSKRFPSQAKSATFFLTEGSQPALDLSDSKIRPAALARDAAASALP
ncbi:galactokinase family protein [soil metagenome]